VIRVHIPTIIDNKSNFQRLFLLQRLVQSHPGDVVFDFSRCKLLRQNGVAFLGGMARNVQAQQRQAIFDWSTIKSDELRESLKENGFSQAFGFLDRRPGVSNHIPYREHGPAESNEIVRYLQQQWLGRGWVNLSNQLRDAIVGRMWELYTNAFEHSKQNRTFSCGQYYANRQRLKLTIVDFGTGIPQQVRAFFKRPEIRGDSALEWACHVGTTTSPNGAGRGLGLDLVREFVRLNEGALQIFSGDGYAVATKDSQRYDVLEVPFSGTLINITFRCDERYYFLTEESTGEQGQLF
jgi:anti-sigma regulatory factor (Ser/Thr protein kinase)